MLIIIIIIPYWYHPSGHVDNNNKINACLFVFFAQLD